MSLVGLITLLIRKETIISCGMVLLLLAWYLSLEDST